MSASHEQFHCFNIPFYDFRYYVYQWHQQF